MRKLILSLLFVSVCFSAFSQDNADDYVNDNVLRYDDYIYKPQIRTVQLYTGWEYGAPIIRLGSGDMLTLAFDDLDSDLKPYSITFIQCNADWTPSSLMQSEYLSGYTDINLQNYKYSMNTYQKYTHYSISFPQSNVQFTKSGNYLMYVYADGNRDNIVLSRRFMIFDDRTNITATFRQPIGVNQFKGQQLDFTINPNNYDITNPFKDLQVVITQNNRWDNAVTDIRPTFLNGSQLVYSMDEKSSFPGGNEFRYFDMRSLRFLTEKVSNIYRDDNLKNHVVIYPDPARANKPYLYYQDINGNFVIKNSEVKGDMDTEADYVYTEFFLPYTKPEANGNFYVMGKLTDWRINSKSKMKYNDVKLGYEVSLYLKQGYYNYIYVLSSDNKKKGPDETITEGSYWDTENDYYVYVYHRKFGQYYDQLIGAQKFNTFRK